MGQSVYINFDTENLRSARCRGIGDLRNQKFTQFVVGDSIELDLYLTGTGGELDIQDYSEIRVGMGNLDDRPESGSYQVAGSETLAYNHSASDLQTAVASVASSNVTTELTGFVFKIQFDAVGAQNIPSLDITLLQPRSTVSVTRLVTGDATTKEVWLWRLFRDPLAFTNTFTNIANKGVRGTLSLATAGLYELIAQSGSVKTFFEVELTSSAGNVRTILQAQVDLNGEVIGHSFSGSVPSGGSMPAEATAFLQSFPNPDIVGDLTVDGDVDLNSGLQVYGDVTFEEGVDFEKGAEFKGGVGISTGAAAGYVLTSDATGSASWQANAAANNKGFFATLSALTTAYPTGQNGWYAIVGTTDTFWVWDTDTTAWKDTDSNSLGTVTSVGITDGAGITSSGSPVTSSGNITVGLDATTQTTLANLAVSYPFTTDFLGSTERTRNLTSITGTSGFKNQSTLDDIYIGSNVTSIGSYSFQYSGNFNISIAPGLTTIANSGFGGSYIIGSLKLPNSVTTIGTYAFIYSTLTSITLPTNASFTTISSGAFSYSSITSLTIPDNVTTIGSSAFAYGSLSSLTIPDSVTTIGDSAFAFSSLTSVTLPTNASFTTIASSAFQYCGLTSITIPSNVTSIGGYSFASTGLTSVTIPSSVTTIGSGAFRYASSLATINCLRMTPPTVTSGAFYYVNTTEIHVPELATGYGTTLAGLTVVKDL